MFFFKVNHLSKYLWTRLCVDPPQQSTATTSSTSSSNLNINTSNSTENDFQIFICLNDKLPNSYQLLNENLTLELILEKHWKLNRPIELFYYLKSNAPTNNTNSTTTNGNNNDQLNGICTNSNSSNMSSSSSSASY